jgi:hypothetical protein
MRAVQLKTLSLVLLLLLSALLGIIVVRTAQFHSRQFAPEAPAALALDGSVVERLAQALRYRTISAATANSAAEFSRFHSFLENAFPRIHRTLTRESSGTYSLLFTWPGSDGGRDPILLLGHIDVVAAEAAGPLPRGMYGGAARWMIRPASSEFSKPSSICSQKISGPHAACYWPSVTTRKPAAKTARPGSPRCCSNAISGPLSCSMKAARLPGAFYPVCRLRWR